MKHAYDFCMDLTQQKQLVRHAIAERFKRYSEKDRQAESRSICRRVLEHLPKEPVTICAYYPMPTEVNVIPLLQTLLDHGCTLSLPRTEGRGFTFRIIRTFDDLAPGPFKILEPNGDAEVLDLAAVQYVFVPGVAFDYNGNRLGRGNGGYDRWLRDYLKPKSPNAQAWGLALECQMLNVIPTEAHDQKMDMIVTAREAKKIG